MLILTKLFKLQQYLNGFIKRRTSSSIKTLFSVSTKSILSCLGWLSLLFNPIIFVLAIGVHGILIINSPILNYNLFDYFIFVYDNTWILTFYILSNLAILFIHELGHVIAAYRCNVSVDKIGVGIYLIYIVFYADVTMSWLAKRRHRLLIDVAGLYFQFLLSALFLFGSCYAPSNLAIVFSLLFWENLIIMLFNLNPFGLFDGYWILCDCLNISNLRKKSFQCVAELIAIGIFRHKSKLSYQYPWFMYVYSILNLLFLLGVYIVAIWNLLFTSTLLIEWVKQFEFEHKFFSRVELWYIIKIVFLLFVLYFFSKTIFNYYKTIVGYVRTILR